MRWDENVWEWDRDHSCSIFLNVFEWLMAYTNMQLVVDAKRIKYWCCAEFWCVIGFEAGIPSEVSNWKWRWNCIDANLKSFQQLQAFTISTILPKLNGKHNIEALKFFQFNLIFILKGSGGGSRSSFKICYRKGNSFIYCKFFLIT